QCTSVEVFQEIAGAADSDSDRAALTYLAIALDKLVSYNSIMCRWDAMRVAIRGKFDRHDFAFQWSYGEMAPSITGIGYDWALRQTGKALEELVEMLGHSEQPSLAQTSRQGGIEVICGSADALNLTPSSIDSIVMDPPYYDNVMYAELSDFFYVWLKRTAAHVVPELFRRRLTDKEDEAVANIAAFRGQKGGKALAGRHYQDRMAAIFTECRRVLKPNGILTLMFTHKATGAWDSLTKALMEAGFTITASWPVNTEAEGSLHIKNKAAANSTIFLACRPRAVL